MTGGQFKERCKTLQIEDINWYIAAYRRCCLRLEHEQKRSQGRKVERLERALQALYDKIVADIEDEKTRRQQAKAAEIAINHAVSDHGYPRTLLKPYAMDKNKESA